MKTLKLTKAELAAVIEALTFTAQYKYTPAEIVDELEKVLAKLAA